MRYQPNHRDVAKLLVTGDMKDAVEGAARAGAAYAESISPHETGEYAASFEVSVGTETGPGGERATAYLANTADHAAAVEWGTGNRAGSHILSRTGDAIENGG